MVENSHEIITNHHRGEFAKKVKRYLSKSVVTNLPEKKVKMVETTLQSMVEPDIFRRELDRRIRQRQVDSPNLNEAVSHWVVEVIPETPERQTFPKRIFGVFSNGAKEANIVSKLVVMWLGGGIRTKIPILGDFLIDTPVKMRFLEDVRYALSKAGDESEKGSLVNEVVELYSGLDPEEVRIFQHPDFLPCLTTSWILNRTYYEGSRQILGWGAFGTLLFAPGISDYFRRMVDVYGAEQATMAGAGILAGLGMVRMGVDCYVLKKRAMTPDVVELFLGLTSGQVDKQGKLRANPRWGLIGAPLDIWISAVWPPYSLAWGVAVPYSIPAYLLAMAVDQITFMGANLFYPKMVEWKDKLVRKVSHEPKSD